uniref:Uncharacterized protein n=1 Tax=Nomascus leucogenys TaxID=61853 RepID=A0A2I3G3Z1_NOMLE
MLARSGITLQKMETPKQTRHRKLKVLEIVCIFNNRVLLVTVQFEILFLIKFYKNAEFCFTFLSYVVKEGAYVTNKMSPTLD